MVESFNNKEKKSDYFSNSEYDKKVFNPFRNNNIAFQMADSRPRLDNLSAYA